MTDSVLLFSASSFPQPEFTSWLQDKGVLALTKLGSQLGLGATLGEAWAFLAHKGHAPLYETLITSRNSTAKDVSPLVFSLTIPLFDGKVFLCQAAISELLLTPRRLSGMLERLKLFSFHMLLGKNSICCDVLVIK